MPGVLFSVSDPRFRHPSPLYGALEEQAAASHLAAAYSFAGAPLPGLPHPALRGSGSRGSQLRDGWDRLEAFCAEFVAPALAAGRNVVVDGFDFDLLLSVVAGASYAEREDLEERHGTLVREHLAPLGLVPRYFLFSGNARQELDEMQSAHPALRSHDDDALYELIVAMNDLRSRYFRSLEGCARPFSFAYPHEGSLVQMWSILNGHYAKQLAAAA